MAGRVLSSSAVTCLPNNDTTFLIAFLLDIATAYLSTVRSLRFRAIQSLEERHAATQEVFRRLDYKETQKILINLFMLEAPWLVLTAKDFAFLRVRSWLTGQLNLADHIIDRLLE